MSTFDYPDTDDLAAASHGAARGHTTPTGPNLEVDHLLALWRAAEQHTSDLAEVALLVTWCVGAGRSALWLEARARARQRDGRLQPRHPVGDTWVVGPAPLGLLDRGLR